MYRAFVTFLLANLLIGGGYAGEPICSPDSKYRCEFVLLADTGMKVVLIEPATGRGLTVIQTSRWATAYWSSKESLFVVEDHWDGQACALYVFEICEEHQALTVREVYHSPGLGRVGVEWTLKEWMRGDKGIRILRTEVIPTEDSGDGGSKVQEFVIPLE